MANFAQLADSLHSTDSFRSNRITSEHKKKVKCFKFSFDFPEGFRLFLITFPPVPQFTRMLHCQMQILLQILCYHRGPPFFFNDLFLSGFSRPPFVAGHCFIFFSRNWDAQLRAMPISGFRSIVLVPLPGSACNRSLDKRTPRYTQDGRVCVSFFCRPTLFRCRRIRSDSHEIWLRSSHFPFRFLWPFFFKKK